MTDNITEALELATGRNGETLLSDLRAFGLDVVEKPAEVEWKFDIGDRVVLVDDLRDTMFPPKGAGGRVVGREQPRYAKQIGEQTFRVEFDTGTAHRFWSSQLEAEPEKAPFVFVPGVVLRTMFYDRVFLSSEETLVIPREKYPFITQAEPRVRSYLPKDLATFQGYLDTGYGHVVFDPREEHEALEAPKAAGIEVGDRVRRVHVRGGWTRTDEFVVGDIDGSYVRNEARDGTWLLEDLELVDEKPAPDLPVGTVVETVNYAGERHLDVVLPEGKARCFNTGRDDSAEWLRRDVVKGASSNILWLPES